MDVTRRSYSKISIAAFLDQVAPRLPPGRVVHHTSLAPSTVALPALRFGRVFLERWRVHEEPGGFSWRQSAYVSPSPAVVSFRDAVSFSTCGAVIIDDWVIADTLDHADPDEHGFVDHGDRISIAGGAERALGGRHLTALCGSIRNYFHAVIDGVGGLAAVPAGLVAGSASVLSAGMPAAAGEMLARFCARHGIAQTVVREGERLTVGELVVSFGVSGQCDYHRCLAGFFHGLGFEAAGRPGATMIYVDRRGSGARRLANEAALIDALAAEGVRTVCLERMDLAEQVRVFRQAGLIIAPHGAGLTNMLFCSAGAAVLELLMDGYCNWSFRHLAGLMGVRYDCVIGRAQGGWADRAAWVHHLAWEISIAHVVAAVREMRGLGPSA